MPGRLEFSFDFSGMSDKAPRDRASHEPARILLLADLSGREHRRAEAGKPLPDRAPVSVDVDNFDELLRRINPLVSLDVGPADSAGVRAQLSINFAELDDFGPDALYRNLELFKSMRDLRRRLLDPATFDEAAAFLKRGAESSADAQPSRADEETQPASPEASAFEQLLGGSPVRESHAGQTARSAIDRLIGSIVEPHIEKAVDPQQSQLLSAVDDSISEQMRGLLHNRDFQSLEALWRGIYDLVCSLETGEGLEIFLLDVTRSELLADFRSADGELERSALYQLLVERGLHTPGGLVWSLLVGDFDFGSAAEDYALLAGMGAVASQAGAPFVAAARPDILGCPAIHEVPDPHDWQWADEDKAAWAAMRSLPVAGWLGLAMPRVLVRLPYGKEADEIEQFAFEEITAADNHEGYLWGNPAFSCAKLAAAAWLEAETLCEPGDVLDITDLPAVTYFDEDRRKLQPGAEALISERAAEHIANNGIMPIMSYRDRNSARLLRFQSISDPPAALRGAWR